MRFLEYGEDNYKYEEFEDAEGNQNTLRYNPDNEMDFALQLQTREGTEWVSYADYDYEELEDRREEYIVDENYELAEKVVQDYFDASLLYDISSHYRDKRDRSYNSGKYIKKGVITLRLANHTANSDRNTGSSEILLDILVFRNDPTLDKFGSGNHFDNNYYTLDVMSLDFEEAIQKIDKALSSINTSIVQELVTRKDDSDFLEGLADLGYDDAWHSDDIDNDLEGWVDNELLDNLVDRFNLLI